MLVLRPEGLDSLLRWRFVFSDSSHRTWTTPTSTHRVRSVLDQIRSRPEVLVTPVDQDSELHWGPTRFSSLWFTATKPLTANQSQPCLVPDLLDQDSAEPFNIDHCDFVTKSEHVWFSSFQLDQKPKNLFSFVLKHIYFLFELWPSLQSLKTGNKQNGANSVV